MTTKKVQKAVKKLQSIQGLTDSAAGRHFMDMSYEDGSYFDDYSPSIMDYNDPYDSRVIDSSLEYDTLSEIKVGLSEAINQLKDYIKNGD